MTSRRAAIVAATAGFVAGCGGGAVATPNACASAPKLVSWFGDSLTSGSIALADGTSTHLAVRPVARALELLGGRALCIDRSVPGASLAAITSGWRSTLAIDPSSVLVLRVGGVDALVGTAVDAFESVLEAAVRDAQAAGKRVVLPGVVHMVWRPEWQPGLTREAFDQAAGRAAALDAVLRRVVVRCGAPFVDIRALRFDGPADIADAVHPAQAYSDRCIAAIVESVNWLL